VARRTAGAGALLVAGLLLAGGSAGAASIAADAETLGATAELTARLPASRDFTVTAAGQVRVTLTDLAAPQALTQLKLIVSRGGTKVVSLDSAGNQQFAATPGIYKVQAIAVPAAANAANGPAGSFNVEVRELAGNTVLRQFSDGVAALPAAPTAQSNLDTSIQFTQAGSYQVTLTDRGLPVALASIGLLLSPGSASGDMVDFIGPCSTACTRAFTVTSPGSYDLIVPATAADPDQAGLYSLKITGGPGNAVVYNSAQPVGRLAAATDINLAAGAYTLAATDLVSPLALSALKLRVLQGAELLAPLDAAGTSIAFNAPVAGIAKLYAFGRAAAGIGAYSIGITQGAQATYRDVRTLPAGYDATLGAGGYHFNFTVPGAANYRLRLRDLNFPTAFAQLRAVVVQNGSVVQSVSGGSIDTSFALVAGPVSVALIGNPSAANANSLLGISLAPQAGGAALLDRAQGIGPLFAARVVDIPTAGSYDLSINDLQFPAAFSELAVAVTRGSELVGQIFGSGMLRFDAQAGAHSINLLARPDAIAKYATWGLELAATPAAPGISIAASPEAVGQNATTTITWSATNATSCTASGGWSGARALSGTEVSTAIAGATTFTLSCSGAGGSTSRSASVTIAPASGKGGGGALGASSLLALAGLLYARRRRLRA
jgi:hypothetical protein